MSGGGQGGGRHTVEALCGAGPGGGDVHAGEGGKGVVGGAVCGCLRDARWAGSAGRVPGEPEGTRRGCVWRRAGQRRRGLGWRRHGPTPTTMDLPAFFSRFPLHTLPPVPAPPRVPVVLPTLAIAPPRDPALLSTDVECLKWQAYLALRGLGHIALRWDISPEGALDARLPNLHLPDRLLPPRSIPAWADARLDHTPDPLDGYSDQRTKDESHAWIALLEGVVHAALVRPPHPPPSPLTSPQSLSQPDPPLVSALFQSNASRNRALDTALNPPPPPSSGFTSPFPPFGANIDLSAVQARYAEAIAALSDRLATDKWFLGSQ